MRKLRFPTALRNLPIDLHLDQWLPPDARFFSIVLLLCVGAHAVTVAYLPVRMPRPDRPSGSIPQVVLLGSEPDVAAARVESVDFQVRYRDPSAMAVSHAGAFPRSFDFVDAALPKGTRARVQKLPEIEFAPPRPALDPLPTVAKQLFAERGDATPAPPLDDPPTSAPASAIVFSPEIAARAQLGPVEIPPVPEGQVATGPTVVALALAPDGRVESALVQNSSGVSALDRAAAQMTSGFRFEPALDSATVWSTVAIYWPYEIRNVLQPTSKPLNF